MDNFGRSTHAIEPHWELYAGDAKTGISIVVDNETYVITAVNRNPKRVFPVSLTLKNTRKTAWQRSQGIGVITRTFREKDILIRAERLDFLQ